HVVAQLSGRLVRRLEAMHRAREWERDRRWRRAVERYSQQSALAAFCRQQVDRGRRPLHFSDDAVAFRNDDLSSGRIWHFERSAQESLAGCAVITEEEQGVAVHSVVCHLVFGSYDSP